MTPEEIKEIEEKMANVRKDIDEFSKKMKDEEQKQKKYRFLLFIYTLK